MAVSVEAYTEGVATSLDVAAQQIGVSVEFVAQDQMRLWINDIIKIVWSTVVKARTCGS